MLSGILFADKYINWIDALPQEEQVINIFMELSALGMAQPLGYYPANCLYLFLRPPMTLGKEHPAEIQISI